MIDISASHTIIAPCLVGALAISGAGQVLAQDIIFDHDKLAQLVAQCQTVLVEQDIDSVVSTTSEVSTNSSNDTTQSITIQTQGSDFTVSVWATKAADSGSDAEKLISCNISGSPELSLRMPDLTNRGSAALSAELTLWFDTFLDKIIEQKSMLVVSTTPGGDASLGTTRQAFLCFDDNRILTISLEGSMNRSAESINVEMISPEGVVMPNGDSVVSFRYVCEITRGQN